MHHVHQPNENPFSIPPYFADRALPGAKKALVQNRPYLVTSFALKATIVLRLSSSSVESRMTVGQSFHFCIYQFQQLSLSLIHNHVIKKTVFRILNDAILPKFVPLCPVQRTNPGFHDSTAHMTRTRTRFGAMFSAIPGTHPGNGRVTTPRGVQKG